MREPRMDEAELASLHPVIVAPDSVTLTELAGSTLCNRRCAAGSIGQCN
jgi:hypothetical protein